MIRYISIPLIILFLLGCEGKEGPTGPAGPTGNANVEVITFNVDAFSFTAAGGDTRVFNYPIDIPSFTTNNGAVLLYMSSASVAWFQIPINEPTFPLSIAYYFDAPTILFDVRTNEGNAISKMILFFNGETDYLGRLVIIPEGTTAPKDNEDIDTYLNSMEGVKHIILSENELITKQDF